MCVPVAKNNIETEEKKMPEIIKTYRQSIPALRFIGKKYGDSDRVDGTFGAKWDGWFANNWFELLKKNAARADFEDGDAAIGLMRYKEKEPGKEQEPFEYWIGIFFPENTPVPDGFEYVDFPASDLGVAWLYGKENEVYCHEGDCAGSCMSKGYNIITDNSHAYWFFERYAQPRFFTPDEKGNIILDICHYIEKENVKMAEGDDSIGVKIIPNVPRIAMFIGSQSYLTPFVGSLYAALQSQGESWQYSDVLAMSGAGNRLRWMPGCWDPGNVDILNCEGNPFAPHFRAFKAVGWNAEVKLAKPIRGMEEPFVDYETARRDILASIDRGIPVIAMGIIGPPECCVVFGYKNDGEKLIGWNYFQTDEGFDGEKPFEKAEWFPNLWGYILLTGKRSIRQIFSSCTGPDGIGLPASLLVYSLCYFLPYRQRHSKLLQMPANTLARLTELCLIFYVNIVQFCQQLFNFRTCCQKIFIGFCSNAKPTGNRKTVLSQFAKISPFTAYLE